MHSLRTLLSGIVDYAGLFPPARLDMAATVRNFAEYRAGPDAWMLGRLVVPVGRLDEFERCAKPLLPDGDDDEDVWIVTALAAAAEDPQLEADLEAIARFNDRHVADGEGAAFIDTVELKASSAGAIDAVIDGLPEEIFPYFELPIQGPVGAAGDIRGLVAALAGAEAGAKVRTGGLTPDAFPSVEQMASFIAACAAADVPFKATAGLHHPLRHESRETNCPMHGFLNVFVAACLAWAARLDARDIASVLRSETATPFVFDEDGIEAFGTRVAAERIAECRERFAHSFGSCSFLEPLADLRALNLVGAAHSG
ncbi:MAG: hypothetical protein U0575_04880 [Phycisphaerales bacterium]